MLQFGGKPLLRNLPMATQNDVTRREFVKAASAVSAVTAALPIAQGAPFIQKVHAANDQVQYGFIGTGSRGTYLLKHLHETDAGRCIAVCDNWDVNLKKGVDTAGNNPAAYKDYRELLARKDIDAVLIAVPLYLHFPITKDSLQAGKHVFCEKSLVHKSEEVHALRTLVAEHPKQVMQVGLQRRYSQFYKTAKQMVDQGVLGNVTHIRGQWHRNSNQRRPVADPSMERKINWRMYREYAGGNTAELASHQIDVADWMFGSPPEYVIGVGGIDTFKDGRDVYDNTHPATALWYREPKPVSAPEVKKAGDKKDIFKAGATMTTANASRGIPLLLPKDSADANDSFLSRESKFARRWLYSKGIMAPEEDRNPVTIELEDFFMCCKDPMNHKPKSNLEIGLNDSTAVILSNMAMDEHRRVDFSEMKTLGLSGAHS